MNYILFDDKTWDDLLPLTYTRPISEIRIGILTQKERWEKFLNSSITNFTRDYLKVKFPTTIQDDNILINSSVIANKELLNEISQINTGECLVSQDNIIAVRLGKEDAEKINNAEYLESLEKIDAKSPFLKVNYPWDIFSLNGEVLQQDFEMLTQSQDAGELGETVNTINKENIFISKTAKVEFATLNASGGPIYIDDDAEIMEGAVIRGPFYLGKHSVVKMGAKIYGATSLGQHCKVGGELNNVVFFGYSSKAHDGFLGNTVVGEWCNFGADTNNSNLKNNYAEVKMWNYVQGRFAKTGLQFAGLIMGDHSKCGINTMFNTGTVVGVSANIFGSGFPRNFIPSFSWGGAQGFTTYTIKKAFETAEKVYARRKLELTDVDKSILEHIFDESKKYRKY
jgi:UDP-N-acetylglucosamine diphosphorylase/glucosamine-1-phosphate N-acetyltransferase